MNGDIDMDLGRALLRAFGDKPFPYVPDWAIDALRLTTDGAFATHEVDARRLYEWRESVDDLLDEPCESAFAVSYWGHGINSYAWTVLLRRPGLRLMVQCGYGGAFPSPVQDEELADLFALVREVDRLVPYDLERDVVVLESPLRDVFAVGVAPSDAGAAVDWLRTHQVGVEEDLLGAVRRVLEPPLDPDQPWQVLEQVFVHAIWQTVGSQRNAVVLESGGRQLLLTAPQDVGPVRASILSSGKGGVELDPDELALLRRLGWGSSSTVTAPHLDVVAGDEVLAARSMADAVRWVWRLDPEQVATSVMLVVGGDEGDVDDLD